MRIESANISKLSNCNSKIQQIYMSDYTAIHPLVGNSLSLKMG